MLDSRLARCALALVLPAASTALMAWEGMDLLEVYARAAESDPLFQSARLQRELARVGVDRARAGLRPSVGAFAEGSKTYQNIRSSENTLFTVGESDYFSNAAGITLRQPVYDLDALTRLPQSKAEMRQVDYQFAASEGELMLRTVEAYFAYLAARDNLELATAERAANERQLQETELRLRSGLASATAVHEARARQALSIADEVRGQDLLEDARQQVAELIGEPPVDLKPLRDDLALEPPEREDVEVWVRTALFQNPQIKALESALEAADHEVRLKRAGHTPTVELVGSWDNNDRGGTEFGGGNEIANTRMALRVNIPIYQGGAVGADVDGALLRRQLVGQRLELVKRQIEREVRSAYTGVVNGITRVEALGQTVFSQEAALAEKEAGMRAGLFTGLQVLDARRELFRERRAFAEARYRLLVDGLRLERASGSLGSDDLHALNGYLQ
jgi:outer membrane protein